jgi:predicted N-formylglutamate amidohydrolase
LEESDETPIPGNKSLAPAAREDRRTAIHEPYHRRIASEIARRRAGGVCPILIALHSFTPVLGTERRPWQIGILYDGGDTMLSRAMLKRLRQEESLAVGDNEPYRMDGADHTIPRHAYPNRTPYLEVEFRQDLLSGADEVRRWSTRFAGWLTDAIATL